MLRVTALLSAAILVAAAVPPSAALAQDRPIALDIPAQFPINFPAVSPSTCWKVVRLADGRITADVFGPGNWNVCIGDASCPMKCGGALRSASTEPLTPGSNYFVKVETQTPGVTATLAIYPSAGGAPGGGSGPLPTGTYAAGCGLGAQWPVNESGWTGTWVRRGSSNIFDASWRKGGDTGSSVLTMSLTGSRVHIERRDAPSWGGAYVEYVSTIACDATVSGSARVPATGAASRLHATIRCGSGALPSGTYAAGCGLGVQWSVNESGWTGTWVRRGSSSIFDASWRKGGDTGSSVLTMSLTGNRVHIEWRDAPSWGGAYVEYDSTIAGDGTAR